MKDALKILAIEDNRDDLAVLKAILADKMPLSTFLFALNGPEGIYMALNESPDVILVNVFLPGTDGFAVCREIKKNEGLKYIPVVIISALRTDPQTRIKALEAGAEGFLSKPLDEQELLAQMRAMAKIKAENQLHKLASKELTAQINEKNIV
ncbi:MAG: response regulator, partial [Candidatus Firestonebacteria bacterium]